MSSAVSHSDIPPHAQGAPCRVQARLVRSELNAHELQREVASHTSGAIVLFVGTVRDTHEGREVLRLEYSAYEVMAAKVLHTIADEAATRSGASAIAVEHRLGLLQLGDASIVIAVAHQHRAPAFDAACYIIEEVKKRVPIWKLEYFADGSKKWVDPTRLTAPSEG